MVITQIFYNYQSNISEAVYCNYAVKIPFHGAEDPGKSVPSSEVAFASQVKVLQQLS